MVNPALGLTYNHDFFTKWQPNDSGFLTPNFDSTLHGMTFRVKVKYKWGKQCGFSIKTACMIPETVSDTGNLLQTTINQ